MSNTLEKLRPDRDLQCYFERPSSIAALSDTSPTGFTVSGCWRQQFDWAVVEWNRENVFEHPSFRNLPDGDLSVLRLSYEETRQNAILLDSSLYPTVDWPFLRIWEDGTGTERLYKVPLRNYASPTDGGYAGATAVFELQGMPTQGDYVEIAWAAEHYTYQLSASDTLEDAVSQLAGSINTFSSTMTAAAQGTRLELTYTAEGSNGNRVGVYGNITGAKSEIWVPEWQYLKGGTSPSRWRVDLDFANLHDENGDPVPTESVRKMRWTWAANLQPAEFRRAEFAVVVSNWKVSGERRGYQVAGPESRRIEDDSVDLRYSGKWTESRGNYSGGSIRCATEPGASVSYTYRAAQDHRLYLGSRKAPACTTISTLIDGGPAKIENLELAGEDVLVRLDLGNLAGQTSHTVTVTHSGVPGTHFYFDFLEIAIPTDAVPVFEPDPRSTLATDWDTDHAIALAPERTAWLMSTLGFTGRANHYVGAMWFYELVRTGHVYASGTIRFEGQVEFGKVTEIWVGPTRIAHLNLIGDTPASVAKALEFEVNAGATGVWAEAHENTLEIHARLMGEAGNSITIAANTNSNNLEARLSNPALTGGVDGVWHTDLTALPRLNRAVRDWTRSYLRALKAAGVSATAAFSMELQHGDDSLEAGTAQRYPDGKPCWLNTPALQTNFSPASAAFWQQVYLDMAKVMEEAGQQIYLQFGEVQWWYFPAPASGLPLYDSYTTTTFAQRYGRPMHVFADGQLAPEAYPDEVSFLSGLIGEFTDTVMQFVRQSHPDAQFEVLYPPDVNEAPLNQGFNLPVKHWTAEKLGCFKTENFLHTAARDLNKAHASILLPMKLGFSPRNSSHLVGISDYTTPWEKESNLAKGEGVESIVLFALDQFCLIGYELPLSRGLRRGAFLGG